MWPTFYIPGGAPNPDFISAGTEYVCGYVEHTAGTITIPNPTPIEDGATQLLVIETINNGGATWPDQTDSAWKRVFDSSRFPSSYGNRNQMIFWRTYTTGASPATIGLSGVAMYTNIVLNNPNAEDRWFGAYAHRALGSAATDTGGYRWDGASTGFEAANSGDLAVFTSCPYGEWLAANEPAGADVEFACTTTYDATSQGFGKHGHTIAGLETRTRTANNLLTYCPTLDTAGWTITGLTRTAVNPNVGEVGGYVQLTNNTGTTRHYAEQSVTLYEGRTYLFSCDFTAQNTGLAEPTVWLSYVKPDNTEHGVGKNAGGIGYELTGSTEVMWAGFVGKPSGTDHSVGRDYVFGHRLSFLINPTVTGTYKMRIHVTPTGSNAGADTAAGTSNTWAQISGVVLQEGPEYNQQPHYIPTTSTPVAVGEHPGILFPVPLCSVGGYGAYNGWSGLVMRRHGGTRPVCRLFAPRMQYVSMDFGDYTITNTQEKHDYEHAGYQAIGTSHVVYDQSPYKKLYLELYVGSLGTGVNAAYTIGFCNFHALQDSHGVATVIGDLLGQYSWASNGNTWTDGTQDVGTIDSWSIGDYVGAAIDLENWEIKYYLNGVLKKTQTITNDYNKYTLWRGQFGVRGPGTPDDQFRATYNFKGPFGGRKPTGFVAYDFDNEVT